MLSSVTICRIGARETHMRPNIVFITCHDLGRHLGCYGQRTVASPALDAIAGSGLLFERSFCTAPHCSPSRAALHTGRHAHANGMHGLARGQFRWQLHADERHLVDYLREADYASALFGIQHLTEYEDAAALGYDEVHEQAAAVALGQAAAEWLSTCGDSSQPFYLEVGFFEPHRRYDHGGVEPDDHLGITVPPYLPQTPEARAEFAELQGAIAALDAGVGHIVAALEAQNLLQDTWFIFVTDHGLAMPRAKCTLYDPGIGTALLMHWPGGGLAGGRRIPQMVSHVDIVPTVLEALGLPRTQRLHGRSFWSLLQGADYEMRDVVYCGKTFHTSWEPMRGLRTERHKLILNLCQDIAINVPGDVQLSPIYPQMIEQIAAKRPRVELYDLVADPLEQDNLAGQPQHAACERALLERLYRWMEATGDPLLQGPIASNAWQEAISRLRSAG